MISRFFQRLFGGSTQEKLAWRIYGRAVMWARQPVFYSKLNVADTIDGRFDMILLHLYIIIRRLNIEQDTRDIQQLIQECMVTDMDRTLREIGVGDMSVGKQVKRMVAAWLGRTKAYDEALADWPNVFDYAAVASVIERNVYRSDDDNDANQPTSASADSLKLANYFKSALEAIQTIPQDQIAELGDEWPLDILADLDAVGSSDSKGDPK